MIAHRAQVLAAEMIKGSLDLLVELESPCLKVDAFTGAQDIVSHDVNGVGYARIMLALGVIVTTTNARDLNAVQGALLGHLGGLRTARLHLGWQKRLKASVVSNFLPQ